MRILLYGFGPYRQFADNITARIIASLPARRALKKVIFPVRFRARQFVDALNQHRPDVVLGLGQSSRKQIDIEMRAKNRRRARKNDTPRPIFANRRRWLPTTLKLRPGRWIGRSQDAGDYVCNFSMYVLLNEIARERRSVRFGFIHIPHDYDKEKAARMLRRVLKQCRRPG
jgi:pyrrolidone-carboxylate peptidase